MKNVSDLPPDDGSLDAAATMFAALSEPNRLRLLRLAAGAASVTDLAVVSGEKLTTVPARLAVLHAARLVTRRRESRWILYALADHHVLTMVTNAVDHACEVP